MTTSLTALHRVLAASQEWSVVASQAAPRVVLATGSRVLTCSSDNDVTVHCIHVDS